MKLRAVILFFSFSISSLTWAQSRFQKYFSDFAEYQQFSVSVIDSSYVIAGSRGFDGTYYDFCAAKLDKNGKIRWSKSLPSASDDILSSLSVSSAGDIFLGGHKSDSAGIFDFSLMKLNASGDIQWYKTFGIPGTEQSFFSEGTPAGDFFLSGNQDITQHPVITKINNSGAVIWSRTWGTPSGDEFGILAALTKEGGVILCGALPQQKNFIIKINADGTIAWGNSYTNLHTQYISSLKQTQDGGYLLASSDYRCDSLGCRTYFSFIKLAAEGSVSWAKAVEGSLGNGKSGIETPDGGFAFTGYLRDSINDKAVLLKTDANGNFMWAKSYGNQDLFGAGAFIQQTPDGGFAILGTEDAHTHLIKTDTKGNSGCNERNLHLEFSNMSFSKSMPFVLPATTNSNLTTQPACSASALAVEDSILCNSFTGIKDIPNMPLCKIFPDPFTVSITLEFSKYESGDRAFEFSLYDVFGRLAMRSVVTAPQSLISRGSLPGGIYFYELRQAQRIIGTGKIIAR
jgi:hypothetical protein